MTKSFTVGLSGRANMPHGSGPRWILGDLTIGPSVEALHCSDVELKSIYGVYICNHKHGTLLYAVCTNPGTYNNYASFYHWRGAGTAPTALTSGTHTIRVLITGE